MNPTRKTNRRYRLLEPTLLYINNIYIYLHIPGIYTYIYIYGTFPFVLLRAGAQPGAQKDTATGTGWSHACGHSHSHKGRGVHGGKNLTLLNVKSEALLCPSAILGQNGAFRFRYFEVRDACAQLRTQAFQSNQLTRLAHRGKERSTMGAESVAFELIKWSPSLSRCNSKPIYIFSIYKSFVHMLHFIYIYTYMYIYKGWRKNM